MDILMKTLLKLVFILTLINTFAYADKLTREEVPEPLKPWVDWVLYGQEQQSCTHAFNNQNQRFCAWPSTLKISINKEGGEFSQQWQVITESWVRLPGNDKQWPEGVEIDSVPAVVLKHHGFPAIKVAAGEHQITGDFNWDSVPESLIIPPQTGLLTISRDGVNIAYPRINRQGQLWLDKSTQETAIEDALDIQIYRKINDEIPMQIETRLILQVSGRSRDIIFPRILLDGFTPLALDSPLPARINQNGDLQVQLRPGKWQVNLRSYQAKQVDSLTLHDRGKDQPSQEVWVFDAKPTLRLTEITGVAAIDARQTRLPTDWQQYPAYMLTYSQTMKIATLQRGDANPEPNQLRLKRSLWMDFNGDGYTVEDHLRGRMTRGWRLESSTEMDLGSASINNQPQFITSLGSKQRKGVELRSREVDLKATSRYTQSLRDMPISGWEHDFQSVSTDLYLPPGWRVFSVHGTDGVPNTWLQSWTLLDFFMVLIIAIVITRLWGWKWGIFALLTMVLLWQEDGAPKFIWLNLLAATSLLRVLPEGWPKKVLFWYRNATLLALVVIVLPFIVTQVRLALHPQLGVYPNYSSHSNHYSKNDSVFDESKDMMSLNSEMSPVVAQESPRMKAMPAKRSEGSSYRRPKPQIKKLNRVSQMIDPNANIQTGPGLPQWHWQKVKLQWNSPVKKGQTVHLNLVSPMVNRILNMLRVVLVLLLIARLLQIVSNKSKPRGKRGKGKGKKGGSKRLHRLSRTTGVLLVSIMMLTMLPDDAKAESIANNAPSTLFDEALLATLQQRLLVADQCLPHCAQIERLQLALSAQQLEARFKVHAASAVAIPLPGNREQWQVVSITVDEEPAQLLSRQNSSVLWLGVKKGLHTVVMKGSLVNQPQIQLSLPLLPNYVEWQGEGWTVEGIRKNQKPSRQLQLIRTKAMANRDNDEASENSHLLPLLKVERTLHLGLDWQVDTVVSRLSPIGTPLSMKIPLLNNESVMSNVFEVKQGKVMVNLSSTQQQVQWKSQLPMGETLELIATQQRGIIETWQLDVSPIWHVNISGIPAVHTQTNNNTWLPQWQPLPGEKVLIKVSRPQGVKGNTLTVDKSTLTTKVGKRLRESSLTLALRSSRGGQHEITLPETAELVSVIINDKSQPVRQRGNKVSLPIVPGNQEIIVKYRVATTISNFLQVLPVDIGLDSVNSQVNLELGRDRWILYVNGPLMGPAVLIKGLILVVIIGALVLGRVKASPLRTWQWFLLGIGLILVSPIMIIVVAGWLMAMSFRTRLAEVKNDFIFNISQIGLIILTIIALGVLVFALQQGLLGMPEMQIRGNGSSVWELKWYQDRIASQLPQPWVFSVPLLVYRLLMLLWALWLAFSLINWLRQGWENYSVGGYWRDGKPKNKVEPAKKVNKS